MKVALISLYDLENCAVRILASFLRQRGHQVLEVYFKDWKNNGLVWPTEVELARLMAEIRGFGAHLAGISLRASAYLRVCRLLAQRVRGDLGIPLALGGIHPTLNPESVLDFCDHVMIGEAEHALVELLERMASGGDATTVPGFWSRAGHAWVKNPLRDLEQDLSAISRRDWLHPDKVVIDGANATRRDPLLVDPIFLTSATRGCPYGCSFCYNSMLRKIMKGKGRYWRLRPVDDVMGELREALAVFPNLRRIRFDDEIFPIDGQWLDQFTARYAGEVGLPFECFLEPRAFSEERIRKLAAAGLDVVYLGIQAGDRVSRQLYDRPTQVRMIQDASRLFHEMGIEPRYLVMVDDPVSTEEDRRGLFELLNGLPRPFRVYLFSMTVMPGTELANKLLSSGAIQPSEVEGEAQKTFSQYRVSLDWDRPMDESFWISMMVLANKPWIPQRLLARMSNSAFLRRHHRTLARAAAWNNMAHMALMVPEAISRGEIGVRVLRRFWNPGRWITA